MSERVVLAMSGGVDSSAAAVLLKEQGFDVIGLFMRSGEAEAPCATTNNSPLPVIGTNSHRQGCCSAEDAADARRVADRLGIPFHSLNFHDSFRRIKDYFVDEYLAGRTPNPCVQCNNWLKFGKLWEFAKQVGADRIATGHYARIVQSASTGEWELHRGVDPNKDQSYVLFGINQDILSRIIFPTGTFLKPEIRALAGDAGLRVATKKDSYEICFVPDNSYAAFIRQHRDVGTTSGNFVDSKGNILGQHKGYENFTIGQRKGLGIAFGEPRFVIRIDPDSKNVVLGDTSELLSSKIHIDQTNWLAAPPTREEHLATQLRYNAATTPCSVQILPNNTAQIDLTEAASAAAPGQAAVIYNGTRVIGGGWIRSAD